MSSCAGGTGCLFLNRLLTGNKVGNVSLISCKTSGSSSGMVGVGCSTLCYGGAVDRLLAKIVCVDLLKD